MARFPTRWLRCRSSRSGDWVPIWLGLFLFGVLDLEDGGSLRTVVVLGGAGGLALILFLLDRRREGC